MVNQMHVQTRSLELEQVRQELPALLVVDIGLVGVDHECLTFPTFLLLGEPLLFLSSFLMTVRYLCSFLL